MPIFCCYRGAVDNIPLTDEGSFVITDADAETWICREGTPHEMTNEGGFGRAFEMMAAQRRLSRQGAAPGGTKLAIIDCVDRNELPARLAEHKL